MHGTTVNIFISRKINPGDGCWVKSTLLILRTN